MSARPKRTIRKPVRLIELLEDSTPSRSKRKADKVTTNNDTLDPDVLLKSPKSMLTTMDISDIINSTSWELLSSESRTHLSKLLPPTAFSDFKTVLDDAGHPSRAAKELDPNSMVVDAPQSSSSSHSADQVLLSVFTDPHFLAAAHTFQDHLYSGWLKDDFKAKVTKYEEGIVDGTLAAPWKDEEWEREHRLDENDASTSSPAKARKTGAKTVNPADIRIYDLAKHSVIRVGDILSYKRNFTVLDITVEKDVMVHAINTQGRSLTVLLESGTTQHLPPYLLMPDPPDAVAPMQSMDITSPSMLETGILDLDGRVERAKRPNGNAWKILTVYRWREDGVSSMDDNRGGRESHGTLHYLRNSHFSDA
ncbi:hypothetical protein BT96DRAFT_1011975 [Gymnopus androsaceus JB14]|uniref:ASX DEUBAD domain-containing protein n=1 Tax=Gymnopus androsaceus JB14 TaxID=1447944 RepID=A0A6A4IQN2_9AGAR|nr:hypothetical protein BT96DRAFT_1011975 [Gymnopus androsaceus JB14]